MDENEIDFIENVNVFGEEIQFREGKSIQLLEYNEEIDEIIIKKRALKIIEGISEPVAIVAVGKSWFANVLHGRHDGFALGAEMNGCTRGIQMWNTPFLHHGKRVIVLDCEGIDDPQQSQQWATKLFILCLVISSSFIYNINGIVGKGDIGKLFLMNDLSRYIQTPNCKFLPRLVILLRDFMLKPPNDFRTYFLEKLNEVNAEASEAIKERFEDFEVYSLPYPGLPREKLQHMDKASTPEFHQDFKVDVIAAVNGILNNLQPKYIGASPMSGVSFAKFLKECVRSLNDPVNHIQISVPDEYRSVVEYVAQKSMQHSNEMYQRFMESEIQQYKLPMPWKDFNEMHDRAFNEVKNEFFNRILGSASQICESQQEFYKMIEKDRLSFHEKNSTALYLYNLDLGGKLWKTYVEYGLTFESLFTTQEDFEGAIAIFELEMLDSMLEGPESERVMAKFKSEEYKDAVDILQLYGIFEQTYAEQLKENQESQTQLLELTSKEQELITKMENIKKEHEEIRRRLEMKIETMDNCLVDQQIQNSKMFDDLREDHNMAMTLLKSEEEIKLKNLQKQIEEMKSKKEFWKKINANNKIKRRFTDDSNHGE
ncbi:guanylate-binding protein [Gigaspora rosea]|uniref:Guanylate-binding protein n=1 Tax=Gigaspora rosea TaxID=44941 RepID=A0A397TU47_9GLOM|nr:guanylate-binding protein [Gigaspora rosea]